MNLTTTLSIVLIGSIYIIMIGVVGFLAVLLYDRFVVARRNPVFDESFEQLLLILATIINSELEEYDTELLTGDRPITNQQFEAFYNDITKKILANLSSDLIVALSRYTTEENVIRIIARRTKMYLRDKIRNSA